MEEITFFGHFSNFAKVQSDDCACSCLFFFEIECNNYVCDTHLLCLWDVFYAFTKIWVNISLFHGLYEARKWKKSHFSDIFQILPKSKVTIAHVHAFFSLKLNAIIMFVIHIYYVPETYFTHSQRYGWISHYFMVSMRLENGRNHIFRTFFKFCQSPKWRLRMFMPFFLWNWMQ